ncbi:hypothetical protein FUAX_17730 [Fulvitalea axinellae]|uniref:Signal transduction histidine kinase internal region domain-containing protein n=1 Tax=Fulvitalea axinellae TaxID=1182444 RepID=A0AAU9D8W4_9BACT|nr:hypothetical protein FUAX_17730 [Fulvitalea axinellae]
MGNKRVKDESESFAFNLRGVLIIVAVISAFSLPFHSWDEAFRVVVYNFLTSVSLWLANGYPSYFIDKRISWVEEPRKRLLTGLGAFFIFNLIAIFAVNSFAYTTLDNREFDFVKMITTPWFQGASVIQLAISFLVSVVIHTLSFWREWKSSVLEVERLRAERMTRQFESLKDQLNPHFLFNSLNALSSLVYESPELSDKFIQRLSSIYRYLLDTQEREVVDFSEEIEFTRSYVFLQKIRFGDNLKVEEDLGMNTGWMIPPLSIQLLVENAIKHNLVSKENPLTIKIETKDNRLFVSNNIQRRPSGKESTGKGLDNIRQRFLFLSGRQVEISDDGTEFTVGVPLLEIEYSE